MRLCAAFAILAVSASVAGCGHKGPPLPPLVKLPTAPGEMRAERHGATVDVQLSVPAANSDGTRPANISRIDVYALTADRAVNEGDVLKFGTKIASLPVKAPRDPNNTLEPDEAEDLELVGSGLDQGARAHIVDRLTPASEAPVDVASRAKPSKAKPAPPPPEREFEGPLLTPAIHTPTRLYVGVSVTTRAKNGPMAHAVVAMTPIPPTPEPPTITYDEKAVIVRWASAEPGGAAAPASDDVLPSRPVGVSLPRTTYHVYDVAETTPPLLTRLTTNALTLTRFSDARIEWGQRRCYAVRALVTVDDVSVEGNESPATCVTLTDTFPPAAPVGLQAVPSDAAINLIWDPNSEKDLRGYVVLRGPASAESLEPVTAEPIQETSFQDKVQPGVRYAYAVRAVDTAGNLSPVSARVEETAR